MSFPEFVLVLVWNNSLTCLLLLFFNVKKKGKERTPRRAAAHMAIDPTVWSQRDPIVSSQKTKGESEGFSGGLLQLGLPAGLQQPRNTVTDQEKSEKTR